MSVPVVCFVGKSGSGKTTFLEKVIRELVARGYRVGAIKHDAHGTEVDQPGKDTYRLRQAGASRVILSSPQGFALFGTEELPLEALASRYLDDLDIVLAEGFKRSALPRIEVARAERSRELLCGPEELLAVVSDFPFEGPCPHFGLEDASGVVELLETRFLRPPDVVLRVDGREIPLKPFVRRMIAGAVRGLLAGLKDAEGRWIELDIGRPPCAAPEGSPGVPVDPPPLTGIVLAGGASRRLGTDKALLRPWGEDGPTLLEATVRRLARVCEEVIVVADRPRPRPAVPARTVYDLLPGSGVLGAIYTGLEACHTLHALVVACDLPFLSVTLLQDMAARPRDYDVLIPRLSPEPDAPSANPERVEPLHAIYSRACLEPIRRALEAGARRIVSFFPYVRVRYLEPAEWSRFDPEGLSFRNVNTPEDLAYAERILKGKEP